MYTSSFQCNFITLAAWASLYPSFGDHSSIVLDHSDTATKLAMRQLLVRMHIAAGSNAKDIWALLSPGKHFDDAVVACVAVRNISLL